MKDSLNRQCELPQTVRIEACDCDVSQACLHSGTPGVSTGDGSSVTGDIDGLVPGDRIEGSNVGLGPAGIGMIALGLLLLLCKSWVQSLFTTVLSIRVELGSHSLGHFFSVSMATFVKTWS